MPIGAFAATIYAGPHFETEQPVVGQPTIQRAYIFFGGTPIAMHTRKSNSTFSGETTFPALFAVW